MDGQTKNLINQIPGLYGPLDKPKLLKNQRNTKEAARFFWLDQQPN